MLSPLNTLLTMITAIDAKFEPTLEEDTIAIQKLNAGELTMDDPAVKQAMEYNPQLLFDFSLKYEDVIDAEIVDFNPLLS